MCLIFRGLVHSQLDAGQREEAARTCVDAAQLARRRVPSKMVDVLKLQVHELKTMCPSLIPRSSVLGDWERDYLCPCLCISVYDCASWCVQVYHHLGDGKVFEKETKSSPEFAAVARLYKVKW